MKSPTLTSFWRTRPKAITLVTLPALLAVIATAIFAPSYIAYDLTLIPIYGILALSLVFVWGKGGIFSLGQAGFFGVGAYAYAIAGMNFAPKTGETLSAVLCALAIASVLAAILGYVMFYGAVGELYVAVITLATSLLLMTIMSSTSDPSYRIGTVQLGGFNGIYGIMPFSAGGIVLEESYFLIFCTLIAASLAVGIHVLGKRSFGRVVAGVVDNPVRATLLGYDCRLVRLLIFVGGAAIASLGGALYASWAMIVTPALFGLAPAAMVMIWVLVGGRTSILGAFVGVALVQTLSSALGAVGGDWTPLVLGAVLIVIVLFLPAGLLSLLPRVLPKKQHKSLDAATSPTGLSPDKQRIEKILSARTGRKTEGLHTQNLSRRFGGVLALKGVNIEIPAGTGQALIGPNGAGKSTFFTLVSGRLRPTTGKILLGNKDITRLHPHQRARLGIGIKTQVPSVFDSLTLRENLWLASHRALSESGDDAVEEQTSRVLDWLGCTERAQEIAGELAHGDRQRLEIGMVLAQAPSVALLDEPTAGMTAAETHEVVELIQSMEKIVSTIVVEHDMTFLRQLDLPVTMFAEGEVFASGSVKELSVNEAVLNIYLGKGSQDVAAH